MNPPLKPGVVTFAAKCAACGAACCDLKVNHVTLCDSHFDSWLKEPRNLSEGGPSAMARFVELAKAAR